MFDTIVNGNTRRAYSRWWYEYKQAQQPLTCVGIERWLRELLDDRQLGKSSLNQARAAVVAGAKYLWKSGELDGGTYALIQEVEVPAAESGQRPPRWLTEEEISALWNSLGGSTAAHRERNRVLFWMLSLLGMRREEVAQATWEDLAMRGGKLQLLVHGKGSKAGWVDVPDLLAGALATWGEMIGQRQGPILRQVWRGGVIDERGITADSVYKIIRQAGEAAEIGAVSPHDLRHTVAEMLDQSGVDLHKIAALLRHSSTEQTRRYLDAARGATAGHEMGDILTGILPVQALPAGGQMMLPGME